MRVFTAGLFLFAACGVDPTVKEPYKARVFTADEIRAKLNSGDFRQRLEATKQIDSLQPEEKLALLLLLADDPQPSTRLLAVKKLKTLPDSAAKEKLQQIARSDPDPDVREWAGQAP